jgi:hypothetical protein
MDLSLLFITLNILVLIIDIPFITTSCNCCSCNYQHVNLFNELDGKFGKLNNDECIVRPSLSRNFTCGCCEQNFSLCYIE